MVSALVWDDYRKQCGRCYNCISAIDEIIDVVEMEDAADVCIVIGGNICSRCIA